MKRCFKCLCEKPFAEFYRHAQMGDGHLNKCKDCTKKDVAAHRQANLERIRQYDKLKAAMPHRVAARRDYSKTDVGKAAHARAKAAYRRANPHKVAAHNAIRKAILRGKITPWPCEVCGAKAQAHHPHYESPLLVTWLCDPHHKEAHAITL